MRYVLLLFIILLYTNFCKATDESTDTRLLRKTLIAAVNSSTVTDSLYNQLNKPGKKQPLVIAYLGTLDALKAKHCWNPYYKLRFLSASAKQMQAAIAADPHNLEIRFMRFSIEYNVPGFLGYSRDLDTDREEMISLLEHRKTDPVDKDLFVSAIKFLLQSKLCTLAENAKLHQCLSVLT